MTFSQWLFGGIENPFKAFFSKKAEQEVSEIGRI